MTTVTELKKLTHDLIDTNTNNFSDARMIRGFNKAQDKITNIILKNEYLFQYDDENYTDFNEGFIDIVSGQQDYDVRQDENFADLLFISKVFIKNPTTGKYSEMTKTGITMTTESDTPSEFRLTGKSIIVSKIPNANIAQGLKIHFARVPKPILVTDTTRELGMPKTFDYLIALLTAYDYARAKRMDNRNDILAEAVGVQNELGLFIKDNDKRVNQRLVAYKENNR